MWMCVYWPVIKLLRVVFLPIVQAWRTHPKALKSLQDQARPNSVIEESNTSDEERLIRTSPVNVLANPSGDVPQIVYTNVDV
jgi:hypothetical protein